MQWLISLIDLLITTHNFAFVFSVYAAAVRKMIPHLVYTKVAETIYVHFCHDNTITVLFLSTTRTGNNDASSHPGIKFVPDLMWLTKTKLQDTIMGRAGCQLNEFSAWALLLLLLLLTAINKIMRMFYSFCSFMINSGTSMNSVNYQLQAINC